MEIFKNQMDLILEAFVLDDGIYKRKAVEKVLDLKEKITPYLLEVVENFMVEVERCLDEDGYGLQVFYAYMLLCFFEEPRAHCLFLRMSGLPSGIQEVIFRDLFTGYLSVFLYQTCSGNIDGIKSIPHSAPKYKNISN
jgi:hypothetical protein